MADRYLRLTSTAPGRFLTRRLGLPQPAPLRRWSERTPALDGPLLHLTAGPKGLDGLADTAARTGLPPASGTPGERYAAVLLDATHLATPADLAEVHTALHPVVRRLAPSGRIVLAGAPLSATDHHQAAAQQALEGFVRSLGKEIGHGSTANLLRLTDPAAAESTLRFLLSPRSAYLSGQVLDATGTLPTPPGDPARPLAGRTALITGAAQGIGAAVATALARDGAHVLCLDVPGAQAALTRTAERLGGTPLPLDITAPDAAEHIASAAPDGLDALVHNAGITRDRRLANMPAERWNTVLDVNLAAVLTTTDALLTTGAIRRGGTVIATASIAGIAGNTGQTNYAASKAGIIGLVRALAPRAAAEHGVTVNAVAPGFIETRMTAAVPLLIREAGRRMNSLAQGGLPEDVAETTAWLADPASAAVNGQVIRVCGQSLLGA
ncbi:3-oxoacyl-ACP reductase [Streptomyces sp. NPDC047097]|uniref:3-oxoacyl-ACP reductase n=1 Tax=Streptomyces sp. NPDC047097 TaxID=3155260 RepID=UPI0033C219D0